MCQDFHLLESKPANSNQSDFSLLINLGKVLMCEKVLVTRAALKSIINGKEYTGLQPFTVKCTPPSVTNSFMNMN